MEEIREQLITGTYHPLPTSRREIPKGDKIEQQVKGIDRYILRSSPSKKAIKKMRVMKAMLHQ